MSSVNIESGNNWGDLKALLQAHSCKDEVKAVETVFTKLFGEYTASFQARSFIKEYYYGVCIQIHLKEADDSDQVTNRKVRRIAFQDQELFIPSLVEVNLVNGPVNVPYASKKTAVEFSENFWVTPYLNNANPLYVKLWKKMNFYEEKIQVNINTIRNRQGLFLAGDELKKTWIKTWIKTMEENIQRPGVNDYKIKDFS